jgi:hypothetical protein
LRRVPSGDLHPANAGDSDTTCRPNEPNRGLKRDQLRKLIQNGEWPEAKALAGPDVHVCTRWRWP